MANNSSPAMSVIITTPDSYETIRTTIRHLRRQTIRKQLEIVIVAPSARGLGLDATELNDFCQYTVVEVGTIRSIGSANAAGIRQATAAVVVLTEDHVAASPHWAESLLAAHADSWAAVGPVVRNRNDPRCLVAWADFLIGYGPWLAADTRTELEHLPWHNSSYKRDLLLEYGDRLESMMQAETVLHWDLGAKGHRLCLEPASTIAHLNFERLSHWLPAQFHSGRVFAATRSSEWSLGRRLFYAVNFPLIPLVRFRRILQQIVAVRGALRCSPGLYPTVFLGLTVSALGEMIGYALGAGNAQERLVHFEFHRVRHIGKQYRWLKTA